MELLPKLFIAGIHMAPPMQEQPPNNRQRLNQVWADVAGKYDDYMRLQVSPDGRAAEFAGQDPEGVSIQPPLVQVRDGIRLTAEQSAEKAADIFRTVGRHLLIGQFFNFGVKHIYHFTPPSNDAKAFMHQILGKTDDDLADLGQGVVPGIKYYVPRANEGQLWTVEIEPLLADPEGRTVIVDVDAQFPGPIDLDFVVQRCREARDFVETGVKRYIDKASAL